MIPVTSFGRLVDIVVSVIGNILFSIIFIFIDYFFHLSQNELKVDN